MNLSNILANWKTTSAGAILIALSGLAALGVHVPGISVPDIGTAVVVGIGLILGKDAAAK
jgi:hypothetical protein